MKDDIEESTYVTFTEMAYLAEDGADDMLAALLNAFTISE
jgi:hypothetical protein